MTMKEAIVLILQTFGSMFAVAAIFAAGLMAAVSFPGMSVDVEKAKAAAQISIALSIFAGVIFYMSR